MFGQGLNPNKFNLLEIYCQYGVKKHLLMQKQVMTFFDHVLNLSQGLTGITSNPESCCILEVFSWRAVCLDSNIMELISFLYSEHTKIHLEKSKATAAQNSRPGYLK